MPITSVREICIAYVATLIVFVVIDAIWLSTMAGRLYRPYIGDLLAPRFHPLPAIVFYLLYAAGLTFLATLPGMRDASVGTAMLSGAVLGFTAYVTYDLTNQATLKTWSTILTVADIAWGTFVTAVSAGIASLIATRLSVFFFSGAGH